MKGASFLRKTLRKPKPDERLMNQVTLVLTREELITFLAIIGVATMNGLDEEPLAGLDEREIAERLNIGEQSLINRGLLDLTDPGKAVLDDTLVALVGGSAVPDATFLLSLVNPDGSNDPHYFNATPELLVEHHSPRVGIHQFDYVPDSEALLGRVQTLLSALQSTDSVAPGVDVQIESAVLARFIELVQDKALADAQAALIEGGIADSTATMLLADYTTYPSWVGVAARDLRSEDPRGGETVMATAGDGRCWLLENVAEQSDLVRLHQVGASDCVQAITRLLRPLQQVYQPSA